MSIYFNDENIRGTANTDIIDRSVISFIRNSDTEFVAQGLSGIGFSCELNPGTATSPYNILSLHNGNNGQCREVFIKLQFIYKNETVDIKFPSEFDLYDMESTFYEPFISEGLHNLNIYKKSNDMLEPLCPALIRVYELSIPESVEGVCNSLNIGASDEDSQIINYIKKLVVDTPNLNLGVSIFTYPIGFETMQSIMLEQKRLPQTERFSISRYEYLNLLIMIELLRLFDIGYLHNDIHTGNYLINPNYIYTMDSVDDINKRGRCLIIDMGRVTTHTYGSELPIFNKLRIIYENAQHLLVSEQDKQKNPYKWFEIMMNKSDIVELLSSIERSKNEYQIVTYSWLMMRLPNVINNINDFNTDVTNSSFNFSVLRGGRDKLLKVEQLDNKLIKMDENIKNNKELKTMTDKEIEKLVNPDNTDLNVLGKLYLKMIRMGEKTFSNMLEKVQPRPKKKGGRKTTRRKLKSKGKKKRKSYKYKK